MKKFYQPCYQTDAHGFNIYHSVQLFTTKERALVELVRIMDDLEEEHGVNTFYYQRWVKELFLEEEE